MPPAGIEGGADLRECGLAAASRWTAMAMRH